MGRRWVVLGRSFGRGGWGCGLRISIGITGLSTSGSGIRIIMTDGMRAGQRIACLCRQPRM